MYKPEGHVRSKETRKVTTKRRRRGEWRRKEGRGADEHHSCVGRGGRGGGVEGRAGEGAGGGVVEVGLA